MKKLFVKLTRKDGSVFTQELPKNTLRLDITEDGNGEETATPTKTKTAAAIQARIDDKNDALDYGDMTFEVVDEAMRLQITAELKAAEETVLVEAEAASNTPEQLELNERAGNAVSDLKELDYVSAAEGVVAHETAIKALQVEDDGSDDTLYRMALADPKIGLVGSLKIQQAGTSYPNLTKAVGAAAAESKNDTVEKVQAAALAALGL